MKDFLLHQYTREDRQRIESVFDRACAGYPYTLAHAVTGIVREMSLEHYSKAMNYTLDFFETASQYISVILFGMLRKRALESGTVDESLLKVIRKIDDKRPLSFGDWCNDILAPLASAASKLLADNPLCASLWNVLRPRHNVFLGGKSAPGIVQIRNEYKGHSTTLSEEIYKGVVYTMEPRLIELLEALSPLASAEYFAAPWGGGEVISLKGDVPAVSEHSPGIPAGHYCIYTGGELFLDLFPLIYCDENGFIYVFQSLINEETSHISTNESAVRKVTDVFNDEFDAYMQAVSPSFDISDTLNWDEWVALLHAESAGFLRRVYNEKKYNKELFVERMQLTAELERFQGGEAVLFPLLGEAGQGKTNQLCHWTETLMQRGEAVLIMSGSDFSMVSLEDKMRRVAGASPRKPVSKIMDALHKCALEKGRTVTVFIDAVNECLRYSGSDSEENGPLDLYNSLCSVFCAGGYTQFKVLFTCRSYTWKNVIYPVASRQPAGLFHDRGEDSDTAVRGFTQEEAERAYAIYGELYQMRTPYRELSKGSIIRLRDPLVLKIACTDYLGRRLPEKMHDYSSLSLFHRMFEDIASSYAGNRQKEILLVMAEYFLKSYESGVPVDSISFKELRHAEDGPLARLSELIFKEDGTSVAYGELLNKPERPVLRYVENEHDDQGGRIQFIYERFLEYMLALVYYRAETEQSGGKALPVGRLVETVSRAHTNEVFMGAMRNVLIMDYVKTGSSDTLLDLAAHYGEDYNITAIVNDAVSVLVGENYEEELFSLEEDLLSGSPDCTKTQVMEFNALSKAIQGNKATEETIARYRELSAVLAPTLKLRQLAAVTLLNGIFLTDYYNEAVYSRDPFSLLWRLLDDPVSEVRNDACMYSYYISRKDKTLNNTQLRENISSVIVDRMYGEIRSRSLIGGVTGKDVRSRTVTFLEVGTRLNVLLIIDALLSGDAGRRAEVASMLDRTVGIFRYMTWNFRLVKVLMPFFSVILRRQLTFQAAYVNNVIEYQSFWDDSVVPLRSVSSEWSREDLKDVLGTLFNYSRYYSKGLPVPDFGVHLPKIIAAYRTGDSFTYLALERLLVVNGLCDIGIMYPVTEAMSTPEFAQTQWYDYSRMSMIYVLYQLGLKSEVFPDALWEVTGRWCVEWTRRCRGYFKARNSHKANPMQLYKRNVMTWYAMIFSARHPGCSAEDIRAGIPLFYELLDEAIDNRDKELLVHLIDNISELVSDSGYIDTALELLRYILVRIDSVKIMEEMDNRADLRYPSTSEDIVSLVGKLLGTAKNYFPAEVDSFLKKDIVGLKFPGISRYREDILNYNPGGETLSDLFTHKFGNFLIWSLVNEEAVDEFAYEAMCAATDAPDCINWFNQVVRILFRHLFKVRI